MLSFKNTYFLAIVFKLFSGFVFIFCLPALLNAQPVLYQVKGKGAIPGKPAKLILIGDNFDTVKRIEQVKIAEILATDISFKKQSNQKIELKLTIPPDVSSGRQKIAFLMTGDGFSRWIQSTLSGEPAPEIQLRYQGKPIQDNHRQAIDFGEVETGSEVFKQFKINNTGSASLKLNNFNCSEGFTLLGSFPKEIAPGNSAVCYIKMNTDEVKNLTGKFSFNTNDDNEKKFNIKLKGSVVIATTSVAESGETPTSTSPDLPEKIVLEKISSKPGRPGEQIHLQLFGRGFQAIEGIKQLQLGGFDLTDFKYEIKSDKLAAVTVEVPENISAGKHEIAFLLKTRSREFWLLPQLSRLASLDVIAQDDPGVEITTEEAPLQPLHGVELHYVEAPFYDAAQISSARQATAENAATDLTLKFVGKGFHLLNELLSIEIDGIQLPVVGNKIENDELLYATIKLPLAAEIPNYGIKVLAATADTKGWLVPTQFLTLRFRNLHDSKWLRLPVIGIVFKWVWQGSNAIRKKMNLAPIQVTPWVPIVTFFSFALTFVAGMHLYQKGVLQNWLKSRHTKTQPEQRTHKTAPPIIKFTTRKHAGTVRIKTDEEHLINFEIRLKILSHRGVQNLVAQDTLIAREEKLPSEEKSTRRKGDDLKRIEGIGPIISSLLNKNGIHTFAELSKADASHLNKILQDVGITIANPATWREQANLAAAKKWDALDLLQQELKGGRVVNQNES